MSDVLPKARKERSDAHTRYYGTVIRKGSDRYVRLLSPDTAEFTEDGPYPDFLSARDALTSMNPPHTTVPIAAFERIIAARRRKVDGNGD